MTSFEAFCAQTLAIIIESQRDEGRMLRAGLDDEAEINDLP